MSKFLSVLLVLGVIALAVWSVYTLVKSIRKRRASSKREKEKKEVDVDGEHTAGDH